MNQMLSDNLAAFILVSGMAYGFGIKTMIGLGCAIGLHCLFVSIILRNK